MQKPFLFYLLTWGSLSALPFGGEVAQGDAALLSSSDTLQVRANGKAIIHWEQFNIASGEAVHFFQSQRNDAILNRVTLGPASEILGAIQANCPIYLINPNGVFIGGSACIETAGFLASTADLSNEAFWKGEELLFQGLGDGSIVNLGKIGASGGDVFFIARKVVNEGRIEAPSGIAVLTTHELMLYPDSKQCVYIRPKESASEEGVQNSGSIRALAVDFNTCSPYEKAIQHTGWVEALSTAEQNGRIYLLAEKGGTFVDGSLRTESGEIRILGQKVELSDQARVDVSGPRSGTVFIGGDYQGANPDVMNAKETIVAPGAQIQADAFLDGNGGKVIVWSDQTTSYKGTISACSGQQGGDGGFVEVSGKQLAFDGKVSTNAPFGKIGTLLLDPTNVTIGAADSGGSFSGCIAGTNTFTPDGAATDTIAAATLVGLLDAPCNVLISTVGSPGAGTGGITVSSAVSWTETTTLTLTADSFITVSAAITNTSASTGFTAMNFTANGVGATTNPGILLSAGGVLTTTGGDVILNGTSSATATASHGVHFNSGAIATGSGNITVTGTVPVGATGASVYGIRMNTLNGMTSSSGNITLSGTTNSSGNTSYGVGITQAWTTGTTGTIAFSNCSSGSGTNGHGVNLGRAFTGSGDVTFSSCMGSTGGGNGIDVAAAFTTTGNVTATSSIIGRGNAGSGFSCAASFSVTGAGNTISITANATGTTGACHGISVTSSLSTTGGGSITLNGTGGASSTASHGVDARGTITTATGNGPIFATGTASGTGSGIGVHIQSPSGFRSTSGNITISGTSTASGTNACGAFVQGFGWNTLTTGTLTFINCQGGTNATSSHGFERVSGMATLGDLVFQNCSGGGGSGNGVFIPGAGGAFSIGGNLLFVDCTGSGTGNGVLITFAFSLGGNLTFSNCLGGTGGGHGCELAATVTIPGNISTILPLQGRGNGGNGLLIPSNRTVSVGGSINITANATGTTGACHGISLGGSAEIRTTGSGNIMLNGTAGPSSTASHGIDLGSAASRVLGSGAGTVSCFGTGGAGTGSGYGVFLSGIGTVIQSVDGLISVTGLGSGNGVNAEGIGLFSGAKIAPTGIAGITLDGTASATGGDNSRGIVINGSGSSVTTSSGNILVNGTGGGTGINSSGLEVSGSGEINSTSGSISGTCVGGTGTSGCAGIFVSGSGSLITTATGSINLTGTGGGLTTLNQGISLGAAGGITTTNNAPITLIGTGSLSGTSSNEGIFMTGGSTTVSTVTGNIQMTGTAGGGTSNAISMQGLSLVQASTSGDIAFTNFGDIAIDQGTIQTFGSDITLTTTGSIDVTNASTISVPAPTGNLLLIAGQNITIDGTSQLLAQGTINSSLTLDVDNAFPTAPSIGPGQFILAAGGIVSAGAGTPVKIYTAKRSQNTIQASINGTPFVPGPFGVDTATEKWSVYYPSGTYGGGAFTIYYKEPQGIIPITPTSVIRVIYNNIAANLVQLAYLLPVLQPVLSVTRGHYHFQLCDNPNKLPCAPTFSPYGSFIFEDGVYWVGTSF